MRTYGKELLPEVGRRSSELQIQQTMLSEGLSLPERLVRRALCQRFWTDRWALTRNVDLARYRMEWHAGLLARKRLRQRRGNAFDVLWFDRQPTAYASVGLMRRVPSIVAIDCTQACVRRSMSSALSRATLMPGVRRDGAVFDAASLIVSTSAWAARTVGELYPGCRTPIMVIPQPVNIAAFDEAWAGERAARACQGGNVRALFVGGEFDRKGGFDLLRAWRRGGFAARAHLDLVTDWPLPAALPAGVAVHRGVAAYSERWRELWRAADLFVLPTRHEAFGMVFQEAAAAGLPRIGTRENAIPELIRHGEDGLLVEPGDEGSLVHALEALISDGDLRARMGRAARAFIVSTASLEVYVPHLERAVRRAIDAHRARAVA